MRHSASDDPPKATHPFFWAGYLLVDWAAEAQKPEAKEEPVVRIKRGPSRRPSRSLKDRRSRQ